MPKNANFGDPTAKTCRNSKEDRSLYDKQSALVKKLIYDREKQVEQSVINKAKLGSFYRFVNRKLSCKSGIGPLKADSGKLVDDTEKAEMLNSYFTGVLLSTVDDGILPHFARRVDDNVFSNHVDFAFSDIVKMITHMKSSNTADLQGFSNSFLKSLKFALARPLSALYTHIFTSGKIPSDWRLANVTPVFKKKVYHQTSPIIVLFL